MRFKLSILLLLFSYFVFGQDSLNADSIKIQEIFIPQPILLSDSAVTKDSTITTKKQRKKKRKVKIPKVENTESREATIYENDNSSEFLGLIISFFGIAALLYFRMFFRKKSRRSITIPNSDDNNSDNENRLLLSRRDYYRNIYLKSDAWKRKRYVVLKRDNWRCVHCGDKATQVHHKRYAKNNIGKEPIEWLESICKKCHNSKHS